MPSLQDMIASGQVSAQYTEDFYIYLANIGNLTDASGSTPSATVNIQIQADSSFEWIMSTVYGNEHGATEPFGDGVLLPITVQITDSGAGRQLFSAPVPITMFCGNGKQPFILPVPKLFMAMSNIQVVATNFDTAQQYDNINLAFIGRKLWNVTPINR